MPIHKEENETGKLKAELALSTQAEKIKSVGRAKSPKTIVSKRKVKTNKEPNLPPLTRTTPTREPNLPVRTQIVSRQLPLSQVPYIPRLQPQTVRYNSPPSTPAVRQFQPVANKVSKPISTPTEEKADPMEEWSKISRLGSYGNSEIATYTDDEQHNANTLDTTILEQQQPAIQKATLVSAVQTSQAPNNDELEPLYSEEAAIIGYQNNYQLTVGESVDGKLLTPLIWSQHTSNNTFEKSKNKSFSEKFIIKLEQPLNTQSGFVVLPKGSLIVATLSNVNEAGFVSLQATQVVTDGKEYILPPGAIAKRCCKQIAIRGNGGKPLIASRLNSNKEEIARRDAQTFTTPYFIGPVPFMTYREKELIFLGTIDSKKNGVSTPTGLKSSGFTFNNSPIIEGEKENNLSNLMAVSKEDCKNIHSSGTNLDALSSALSDVEDNYNFVDRGFVIVRAIAVERLVQCA